MAVGYLCNRSFCQELVMRLLSCRGLLIELAVILLGAEIAFAQTVDQPGLVQQYDQAAATHNATIDVLIDLAQKSADPEFKKIIAKGSDAIAAGAESLGFARVNVQAAGTTAGIYAQAVRDGRIADARAAASLWSKQASLARDHLQAWGQSLSMAQAAIEAAKRWLAQ